MGQGEMAELTPIQKAGLFNLIPAFGFLAMAIVLGVQGRAGYGWTLGALALLVLISALLMIRPSRPKSGL